MHLTFKSLADILITITIRLLNCQNISPNLVLESNPKKKFLLKINENKMLFHTLTTAQLLNVQARTARRI